MKPDTYREHLNDLQVEVEELRAKLKEAQTGDLISRQAAIDALKAIPDLTVYAHCSFLEMLTKLPSAQPEIIACADCKHWICHDRRCGYWNHGVKPLEWCCHAERRTT